MWNKINNIKTKLSWSLFGNIVYALSQWGIVTIITRFGTNQDIGVYSLGLAVSAPIVLFFNFQLSTIQATDSKNQFNFNQYYGSRIINSTIAFIIVCLLAFIYSDNNNKQVVIIIMLMGLVKYVESLSDICMGFFQKKDRIDLIGKSQLYRGILTLIIVGSLFFIFRNIILAVVGLLILMIIRFLRYDLKNVKQFINIKPTFDSTWYILLKISFPLGVVSLMNSLNANIPRYFLENFSSINEVGIYSALSYILTASIMIITPVSLLVGPRLASAYNKCNIKQIFKINLIVICFSLSVFLFIILCILFKGETILSILYGSNYSQYNYVFTIINSTIFFTSLTTFFNLNIVAARMFKVQPIINFIVTIITLITSYFFIKKYGLLGGAYSLLISNGIQTILSFCVMLYAIRRLQKEN